MKVTYHQSHSYKDKEGVKHQLITQLYKVGIYAIMDNNPAMQFNLTPKELVKIEGKLRKDEEQGLISELQFGAEITVTDQNGVWEDTTDVLLKKLEKYDEVFIQEGKEYDTRQKVKGSKETYKLTVVKIENKENNPIESTVQFTISPQSDVLKKLEISENLYQSNVGIFQSTIVTN